MKEDSGLFSFNPSLKNKLILSFTLMIILMFLLSFVSLMSLKSASKGFLSYREMARDSNLSSLLESNMLMMRMKVKNFIISGNDSELSGYRKYYELMGKYLGEAQKNISNKERALLIDDIDKQKVDYHDGFEKVVAYRKAQINILKNTLDVKGPEMEKGLTNIMESAYSDNDSAAAFHAGIALKHVLLGRLYLMKFLTTNKSSDSKRAASEFDKMFKLMEKLDTELQDSGRRKIMAQVDKLGKEYIFGLEKIIESVVSQNRIINNTLDKVGPEIALEADQVKMSIKKVQDEIGPRLKAGNERTVSIIFLISFVTLIIAVVLVFIIIKSVLNQLGGDPSEIADIALNIASGNLNFHFNKNKSSRGVYSDMEKMAGNLRHMIGNIISNVETLKGSASDMSDVSELMGSGAEQTTKKAGSVSSAAEEMSASMNTVAASTEQASANIQMIVAASEEISVTIGEITENLAKGNQTTGFAVEKAGDVSKKMNELEKAALEINKVTEAISEISEQTNLLALNATIEASRAGEAGKGFAVVAGEIKTLAKEAALATKEINDKISIMQLTTKETISSISSIIDVVNEIDEIVSTVSTAMEEQSATTSEISKNVSEAAQGIEDVSKNVNETSSVAQEVTKDIFSVNQSTEEIASGSLKVSSNAKGLTEIAVQLDTMVKQFRL